MAFTLAAVVALIPALMAIAISPGTTRSLWWTVSLVAGLSTALGWGARQVWLGQSVAAPATLFVAATAFGGLAAPPAESAQLGATLALSIAAPIAAALIPIASKTKSTAFIYAAILILGIAVGDCSLYSRSDSWGREAVFDGLYLSVMVLIASAISKVIRTSQARLRTQLTLTATTLSQRLEKEQAHADMLRRDAFIHDELIAALEAVALASEKEGRAYLRRAHDRMSQDTEGVFSTLELESALMSAIDDFYPLGVLIPLEGEPTILPTNCAAALINASSEALRNVAAHAYPCDQQGPATVFLTRTTDHFVITVRDQGKGFNTTRRDSTRFGLEYSIRRSMESVGGSSEIESGKHGTVVRLTCPL